MKITAIKQQVKRHDRYSVFVDEKYAFSLSESALLETGLSLGLELSPDRLAALKETSSNDKAYGNTLRYVAMRPRSTWEVRTYLQRKAVDEPVAEDIIKRLQKVALLDDEAFARAWVVNRRLLKATSTRKLQAELKQKHVPEAVITRTLQEDEVDDLDALRQLARKKQHRYPDSNKLMQYLARQGFTYDDIKTVITELRDEAIE